MACPSIVGNLKRLAEGYPQCGTIHSLLGNREFIYNKLLEKFYKLKVYGLSDRVVIESDGAHLLHCFFDPPPFLQNFRSAFLLVFCSGTWGWFLLVTLTV
ncbi:hypothetical protein DOT_4499 [Desulfosporosinus sp. OT]|nr:hypothetical protein DOT_4499 [Desulfosporosinus sp. OT]